MGKAIKLSELQAAAIKPHPITAAAVQQFDMFSDNGTPVMAAYGGGVDSTAYLIDMVENGERVDIALFADTGAEKEATYRYVEMFQAWLAERGVPLVVVRYQPRNFKNFPAYSSLDENCFSNGTLPSQSFGFGSCSIKWKAQPQNKFTESWEPAVRAWANGGKVVKLIGYDCSPADQRRHAAGEGYDSDPRYHYAYPLRERGWTRTDCEERIRRAGLPVPPKSACYMCAATKPHELHEFSQAHLRRIVLMEARAKPRLRNIDGLWRKPVKGVRGGTPRPGSMTEYIREKGLLPESEIDMIIAAAPAALQQFQDLHGAKPLSERPALAEWLKLFDLLKSDAFNGTESRRLYSELTDELASQEAPMAQAA